MKTGNAIMLVLSTWVGTIALHTLFYEDFNGHVLMGLIGLVLSIAALLASFMP